MPSLSPLFTPTRIAVVGASDRIGSIGRKVYTQLTALPQFQSVIPVNPNHKTIGGQKSYANLSEAASEHTIDLAIIVLSADKLAAIIREAAKIHLRHLILINELDSAPSAWRNKLNRAAEAARKARINLISLPSNSLPELFKQPENTPKACAYIGQSTSIADCVARYAQERDITFSRFLTLNTQNYPVSTGQIIDHIAAETSSTALLVHISTLNDNLRELISALTAAARRKPVVVLITLHDTNPQAEAMLLQALERQHILIAHTLEQFFSAAKLIHTGIISRGKHIAIISNSPQISTLTLKTLRRKTDLQLTEPQAYTIRSITKYLPYKPSHHNPLYLPTDALPATFQAAASQYLQDEHIDAIFIIYAGQNTAESQQVAQMVSALQKNSRKPLLLVWLGSADTPQVRTLFNQRKTLHFKQPESALQALAQLNLYHHHNQQRHQIQPPHNYTPAAHTADELHKHIRPLIPVAILPATRMGSNALLAALNLTPSSDTPVLQLAWARQEPIGQTLTLTTAHHSTSLLPPIQPTALAHALNQLQLPPEHWQDWLLNTSEILARLPEIHDLTLHLASPSHHHSIKLNLQDPNSFSGCPNILAPIPTAQHTLALRNGETAILRSVRSEDAALIQQLIQAQSEHSRYTRFMSKASEVPPALLAQLASPDYHRDYALILHTNSPTPTPLAHANYIADPNPQSCEFGIIIDDSLQGQGIGHQLMTHLIAHAKAQGHTLMRAEILADNHPMQKLALKLGFTLNKHPHDNGLVEAKLHLM
ncbi:GNAT family N-acetyltransferase [Kingella oralis]|uniref:bifunctional acetate--CoA ligase family protein/GNAT family N-acetyltransferase n=1 Tax=Kingella oralis TaxID=505 RepID=UPI002D7F8F1B|nr:GNAT family N-acetyltransferase [Kingella oralis]